MGKRWPKRIGGEIWQFKSERSIRFHMSPGNRKRRESSSGNLKEAAGPSAHIQRFYLQLLVGKSGEGDPAPQLNCSEALALEFALPAAGGEIVNADGYKLTSGRVSNCSEVLGGTAISSGRNVDV